MSAGKIVMAMLGGLLGLLALGFVVGGIGLLWATTQRADDGYFTSRPIDLSTETYALSTAEIDLDVGPGDWLPSSPLASVRMDVESAGGSVFVGIGERGDVDAYLDGVGHAQVTDARPLTEVSYRTVDGVAPGSPPGDQDFWVTSAEGEGTQTLSWDVEPGEWVGVIMNSDGSAGVTVQATPAARLEILGTVGVGLLVGGLILGVLAAVLLVLAVRRPAGATSAGSAPVASGSFGSYPVRIEGSLDPNLSRWQWLLKWLLGLPHFVVLAFLWVAFILLTVVAGFAILFTGRYPRSIFDFNVGVLRWSWRVAFWSYGVLATDQYPPFSLAEAEYPARFDVEYPEQLSRLLVLVKWWLLAIPHYIIVGLFTNGLVWWTTELGEEGQAVLRSGGGLITILVIVAGIALLFTGRYPQGLFDLLMGLQRWVYRVVVYAALMRDEYPPFRLDTGGEEAPAAQLAPAAPPT